jgi:hypothetical protein
MKELVEVIAKALVDHPDEVSVTETKDGDSILVELKVAQEDIGEGNRPSGPHCQGNPFRRKGGCCKDRRKSRCGNHTVMMREYFEVGIISGMHGLKGEVKVYTTSQDPSRFETLKTVLLDLGEEKLPLEIEGVPLCKEQSAFEIQRLRPY